MKGFQVLLNMLNCYDLPDHGGLRRVLRHTVTESPLALSLHYVTDRTAIFRVPRRLEYRAR